MAEMTDIEKLAQMARDLDAIENAADEQQGLMQSSNTPPHHPSSAEAAEKLLSDASMQRTSIEETICFLVPTTIGDALTQFLCLQWRVLDQSMSGDNERLVRIGFRNLLTGLIALARDEGSPLLDVYARDHLTWNERTAAFMRSRGSPALENGAHSPSL